jgi:hypothetical protein
MNPVRFPAVSQTSFARGCFLPEICVAELCSISGRTRLGFEIAGRLPDRGLPWDSCQCQLSVSAGGEDRLRDVYCPEEWVEELSPGLNGTKLRNV